MKNAVLIAAHDRYEQLELLLNSLDSTSVDIYIYILTKKLICPMLIVW